MLMYRPGEGSRHTLILDLLLLASLLLENRRPAAATAAVSVLLALTGVLSLAKGYGLPRYSEVWDNEVQQVQAALEKSQAAVDSEDPWTIRRHTPFSMRFTADCCTACRTAWESSLTRTAIWRMQPIRSMPGMSLQARAAIQPPA